MKAAVATKGTRPPKPRSCGIRGVDADDGGRLRREMVDEAAPRTLRAVVEVAPRTLLADDKVDRGVEAGR